MIQESVDVLVLGGGPAGINAAVTAARHGLKVVLVDMNHGAGGQVFRPLPSQFKSTTPVQGPDAQGDDEREKLRRSTVQVYLNHTVWNVTESLRVDAVGPDGPRFWECRALVMASGTTERVVPFPGWDLPGVIGLAAATILLKSQKMLPGQNTLVAGCGPLLTAVAAGILDGGGTVTGVVDAASRMAWLRTTPDLVSRPDLMWQGVKWLGKIKRSGAPVLSAHAIERIEPAGNRLKATIAPVDEQRRIKETGLRQTLIADAVVVGNGLVPGTDVSRALRAEHRYVRELGGWIPVTDADCRTTVAGVYAAGDGCGVSGAAAAIHHGELAGLSVALDLGVLNKESYDSAAAPVRTALAKASRFGRAMGRLMALPEKQVATIAPETIVCRCEDVTRSDIDSAVEQGAIEMNQVKAWTRCGMGPCQGRTCGDVAADLVALKTGSRESAGFFTGRGPLRPVSLEQLTGDYEYSDIPLPKAAPL